MWLSSIFLPFTLLLSLAGLGVQARINQCTRDCILEWCLPICADKLACRVPCMDDCEDSCKQCEREKNCPADLPNNHHIAISNSHGALGEGLWVTGTSKKTDGDDESGVKKAVVVPKFTRLKEALWREDQEGLLVEPKHSMDNKVAKKRVERRSRQRQHRAERA